MSFSPTLTQHEKKFARDKKKIFHFVFLKILHFEQTKLVKLKPGALGIKVDDDGKIIGFTNKAQEAFYDARINQDWKIVKIDSKKLTKELLMEKACGSKNYTMEFVYIGNQTKLVTLKPGAVGIKFGDNGKITGFTSKAQQALYDAGINQDWKIVKIDSEKITKEIIDGESLWIKRLYNGVCLHRKSNICNKI